MAGRGRGATLPAWMTAGVGAITAETTTDIKSTAPPPMQPPPKVSYPSSAAPAFSSSAQPASSASSVFSSFTSAPRAAPPSLALPPSLSIPQNGGPPIPNKMPGGAPPPSFGRPPQMSHPIPPPMISRPTGPPPNGTNPPPAYPAPAMGYGRGAPVPTGISLIIFLIFRPKHTIIPILSSHTTSFIFYPPFFPSQIYFLTHIFVSNQPNRRCARSERVPRRCVIHTIYTIRTIYTIHTTHTTHTIHTIHTLPPIHAIHTLPSPPSRKQGTKHAQTVGAYISAHYVWCLLRAAGGG